RYHDIEGWSPLSGSLGFHAAPTGSDWMITRSWAQGLRAGEVVERINGEAPGDAYDQQERCISASNERGRRRNFFRCPHLFALKILLRVDGRNVRFRRVPGKREPPMERTAGHWLQHGKVGYVRIPSFGDPKHEARALELVKDFHEASAILVDVRGNTGGSTPERLIEALMDRPSRGWTESTP
ncbi:peptidase, S41 family, partial [mine drainage metagenome]